MKNEGPIIMAAEHLHVEVAHVDGAPRGLAGQGVAFDQQGRERLAAFRPIAERKALLLRSCSSASCCSSGSRAAIFGSSAAQRISRMRFMPPAMFVNLESKSPVFSLTGWGRAGRSRN